jgi:hypothetical protein
MHRHLFIAACAVLAATAVAQFGGITMPSGMTLPPGGMTLPPGATIPSQVTLPSSVTLPADVTIPPMPTKMTLPPDMTLPKDVTIPPMPTKMTMPPGWTLPKTMPGGETMPPGVTLPKEVTLPAMPTKVALPTLPSKITMPPGMTLPPGASLPVQTTASPVSSAAGTSSPAGTSLPGTPAPKQACVNPTVPNVEIRTRAEAEYLLGAKGFIAAAGSMRPCPGATAAQIRALQLSFVWSVTDTNADTARTFTGALLPIAALRAPGAALVVTATSAGGKSATSKRVVVRVKTPAPVITFLAGAEATTLASSKKVVLPAAIQYNKAGNWSFACKKLDGSACPAAFSNDKMVASAVKVRGGLSFITFTLTHSAALPAGNVVLTLSVGGASRAITVNVVGTAFVRVKIVRRVDSRNGRVVWMAMAPRGATTVWMVNGATKVVTKNVLTMAVGDLVGKTTTVGVTATKGSTTGTATNVLVLPAALAVACTVSAQANAVATVDEVTVTATGVSDSTAMYRFGYDRVVKGATRRVYISKTAEGVAAATALAPMQPGNPASATVKFFAEAVSADRTMGRATCSFTVLQAPAAASTDAVALAESAATADDVSGTTENAATAALATSSGSAAARTTVARKLLRATAKVAAKLDGAARSDVVTLLAAVDLSALRKPTAECDAACGATMKADVAALVRGVLAGSDDVDVDVAGSEGQTLVDAIGSMPTGTDVSTLATDLGTRLASAAELGKQAVLSATALTIVGAAFPASAVSADGDGAEVSTGDGTAMSLPSGVAIPGASASEDDTVGLAAVQQTDNALGTSGLTGAVSSAVTDLAITLNGQPVQMKALAVAIRVVLKSKAGSRAKARYYDTTSKKWSTDGITLDAAAGSSTTTAFSTTHLTGFVAEDVAVAPTPAPPGGGGPSSIAEAGLGAGTIVGIVAGIVVVVAVIAVVAVVVIKKKGEPARHAPATMESDNMATLLSPTAGQVRQSSDINLL